MSSFPLNPYESEELEAEYNARFDYYREAYGPSQLDLEYEAYCDSGAGSWEEWVAAREANLPAEADDPVLDYKPNHDNRLPF